MILNILINIYFIIFPPELERLQTRERQGQTQTYLLIRESGCTLSRERYGNIISHNQQFENFLNDLINRFFFQYFQLPP